MPLHLRLLGGVDRPTAFARVNDHWAQHLRALGHDVEDGGTGGRPDAVVVHDYSRPFGPLPAAEAPPGVRRIAVRTWDFGPYPARWAAVVTEHYDELWVHSEWNRQLAVRGGVPEGRVRVVPHGVDPQVLCPDGLRHRCTDGPGTTFLFVGAAVRRKGFDALLAAYARAFTATDDVQLVVKDGTRDVFYRGQGLGADAQALVGAGGSKVTYLDEELDPEALSSLYRGADALVLPFRAEGFALPTLEAMACGTPPVVPRFGAVLDHCDETTAWFAPHRRINLPVDRVMAYNAFGFEERIAEVDLCEPDVGGLCDLLRSIAATPREVRAARGRAAAKVARGRTWAAVAQRIEAALT